MEKGASFSRPLRFKRKASVYTIFQFDRYTDFLNAIRTAHPHRRRAPTLNEWAATLGYKSPRSIAMILKGQRLPSTQMIQRLALDLQLTLRETRYLDMLVEKERLNRKGRHDPDVDAKLAELNPTQNPRKHLDEKDLQILSQWYTHAIRYLVESSTFQDSLQWIHEKLRKKVSPNEIRGAIESLKKAGYIKRDLKTKRLISALPDFVTSRDDVPSEALRQLHQQFIHRALEALQEQEILSREFGAVMLRFDPARMPEAKKMIREFRQLFNDTFSGQTDRVYQLNMQFFEHTQET